MKDKKIELLSPAGNMQRLKYALLYGADAVYLSLKDFGMRASAGNFTFEELSAAITKSHEFNAKVYLACNIIPTNAHIDRIKEFLKNISYIPIDGIIVADIGTLSVVKKYLPNIDIHISTQAGIVNYLTAQEFYNMGAKRVILARELSLEDIKIIREKTNLNLELEAFIHGSMCVSFSGRCLLSNYLAARDANNGECAQPCRWEYSLIEENRPNQFYTIVEDREGSYILNAKDLCMIEHIDKLIKSGIDSFKIEGRAKSFYYVSIITNAYRQAIDICLENNGNYALPSWLKEEVNKISHREYCTGFYFGQPTSGQFYASGGYIRDYEIVAVVKDSDEKLISCIQYNKFKIGDEIEIISPGTIPTKMVVMNMWDEDGNAIDDAPHAMMNFKISNNTEFKYPKDSIIRVCLK